MLKTLLAVSLLASSPAWAGQTPNLMYDNSFADMTYPSVSGDYLVYNQRVGQNHQIMRVKTDNLYASAADASTTLKNEVFRNGTALSDGSFAYASNSLGHITPWLAQKDSKKAINIGLFQNTVLPNHLNVSADGKAWVFDSTLAASRTPHIIKNFANSKLTSELLGQEWRMYHERLWKKKSGYPKTKTGLNNAFSQPYIFTFTKSNPDLTMLSDGFDASLSVDGSWMVFVREDNGNFDLWKQNIDGSGLQRLTKNTYADLEPSLSPDGKHVVFVSNRDSRGDIEQTFIHLLDLTSGKVTSLTSGLGVVDGGPAWLNKNTIIFHSNRDPKSPQNQVSKLWRLWTVHI